ncbi:MAG: InlB B-repeat-containing protein, partial [Clostridiales Family XIII bacterium]|nr:InlB B-repeat-containing protein [Clostridiales Family XIII bacterium]
MWGMDIQRGGKPRRASLIIAMVCVVAFIVTSFQGVGYGDDEPVRYKISFYQLSVTPGGGVSGGTVSVSYDKLSEFRNAGETAKNPGPVAYLGKDNGPKAFMGWYEFSAPDERPYDFSTPVNSNVKLFARFADGYLVTFLNGFGDPFLTKIAAPTDYVVSEPTNEEMSLFTAPAGKHFSAVGGWLKGGDSYDFEATVNEDITLSPTLTDGASVISFVSDGTQVPFMTVGTGETASPPNPSPTREGYAFAYWSEDRNGDAFLWSSTPINGD